jgi:hypothetical protein
MSALRGLGKKDIGRDKDKGLSSCLFFVGGLLILLCIGLITTRFSCGEDGLLQPFDLGRAILVAVLLCIGVFSIVGPFCKLK